MKAKYGAVAVGLAVVAGLFVSACSGAKESTPTPGDGASDRRVVLHVHGLEAAGAADAVQAILAKQAGVSAVALASDTGSVSFELAATGSLDGVIAALREAGYAAHVGRHDASKPDDGDHPKSEDPDHPKADDADHPKSDDADHPEPDHPEHPK